MWGNSPAKLTTPDEKKLKSSCDSKVRAVCEAQAGSRISIMRIPVNIGVCFGKCSEICPLARRWSMVWHIFQFNLCCESHIVPVKFVHCDCLDGCWGMLWHLLNCWTVDIGAWFGICWTYYVPMPCYSTVEACFGKCVRVTGCTLIQLDDSQSVRTFGDL